MCENGALYLYQIISLNWGLSRSFVVVHDQVKRFAIYSVLCLIIINVNNLKLNEPKKGSFPHMPVTKLLVLSSFNVIAKSNHTSCTEIYHNYKPVPLTVKHL